MSQIASAGRSLTKNLASIEPQIEPLGTLALTGYFWEDFPSRTTQSCLLLRKEKITLNI